MALAGLSSSSAAFRSLPVEVKVPEVLLFGLASPAPLSRTLRLLYWQGRSRDDDSSSPLCSKLEAVSVAGPRAVSFVLPSIFVLGEVAALVRFRTCAGEGGRFFPLGAGTESTTAAADGEEDWRLVSPPSGGMMVFMFPAAAGSGLSRFMCR